MSPLDHGPRTIGMGVDERLDDDEPDCVDEESGSPGFGCARAAVRARGRADAASAAPPPTPFSAERVGSSLLLWLVPIKTQSHDPSLLEYLSARR